MEFRDNGLLYESLFPVGIKYHPDIYYDFESYMWRAILSNGELCQGDLRSMVRMFVGEDVRYHYEVDGEERVTSMFETVVRDAVENPETFGISMYLSDYSEQEWSLLVQLCEKLNTFFLAFSKIFRFAVQVYFIETVVLTDIIKLFQHSHKYFSFYINSSPCIFR